jgi:hypothetical protein
MTEKEKCFICKKPAIQEFYILIDDGGVLNEVIDRQKTYICNVHLKEFEYIKRKKRSKDDFY